jgi:hypothetical protein
LALFDDQLSRYDFNGDGSLGGAGAPFKGNNWTDLQVLQDLWPTDTGLTEYWLANELDLLIPCNVGSGDIEFRTYLPLGPGAAYHEICIGIPGLAMSRSFNEGSRRLVWTVPAGIPISVQAEGYKGGTKADDLCVNRPLPIPLLKHAEDTVMTIINCPTTNASGYSQLHAGAQWYGGWGGDQVTYERSRLEIPKCDTGPLSIGQTCRRSIPLAGQCGSGSLILAVTRSAENE